MATAGDLAERKNFEDLVKWYPEEDRPEERRWYHPGGMPGSWHCSVPECEKIVGRNQFHDRKRHMMDNHHPDSRAHKCPIDGCQKAFSQKSNLKSHMERHNKTKTTCPLYLPSGGRCTYVYSCPSMLTRHKRDVHPEQHAKRTVRKSSTIKVAKAKAPVTRKTGPRATAKRSVETARVTRSQSMRRQGKVASRAEESESDHEGDEWASDEDSSDNVRSVVDTTPSWFYESRNQEDATTDQSHVTGPLFSPDQSRVPPRLRKATYTQDYPSYTARAESPPAPVYPSYTVPIAGPSNWQKSQDVSHPGSAAGSTTPPLYAKPSWEEGFKLDGGLNLDDFMKSTINENVGPCVYQLKNGVPTHPEQSSGTFDRDRFHAPLTRFVDWDD